MKDRAERLKNVARLWNEAAQSGSPRVETIRQAYPGRASRTIQRWLREAREEGLLEPGRPGSWGTHEGGLRAAAEDLGVDYAKLVIALREHVGERFRISATEEQHARAALSNEGKR
jgi:hypothetical protein